MNLKKSKTSKTTLLVIQGADNVADPIEVFLNQAIQQVVLDNLDKAKKVDLLDEICLISNDKEFVKKIKDKKIKTQIIKTSGNFHFGKLLSDLIKKNKWQSLFYIGGGAGPLITAKEIEKVIKTLKTRNKVILANNFYSADFFAFTPADSIKKVTKLPHLDNPLAFLLKDQAKLEAIKLEPSVGTFLDIDSPIDLAILSLHPKAGKRVLRKIKEIYLPIRKISSALTHFLDPYSEIFVFGRVGSQLPGYLTQTAKCKWRWISEECGMRAWGREEKKQVFSFLGELIKKEGPKVFFKQLSKLSKVAFLDTRVIFAHLKKKVSRPDRFYSDIGEWRKVKDKWVREFTYEAVSADLPVILGGHSLISGGLYTLVDIIKSLKLKA